MKIGARLTLGFLVVVALTVTVGLLGIRNLAHVNDLSDQMYSRDMIALNNISRPTYGSSTSVAVCVRLLATSLEGVTRPSSRP